MHGVRIAGLAAAVALHRIGVELMRNTYIDFLLAFWTLLSTLRAVDGIRPGSA